MVKNILILCEGTSEINKIVSLQTLLKNNDNYNINFITKDLEGMKCKNCINKIKLFLDDLNTRFDFIYVWLDFDIFKRCNQDEKIIRRNIENIDVNNKFLDNKKKNKKIKCLFNYMNGEDFHILFFEKEKIFQYQKICDDKNHFRIPMNNDNYLEKFKTIIPGYKKSDPFDITKENLINCIANIEDKDIKFKSDISIILKMVLEEIS